VEHEGARERGGNGAVKPGRVLSLFSGPGGGNGW
jgi:hypothetical protein